MNRNAGLLVLLFACGKTSAFDEQQQKTLARTTQSPPPWALRMPDPGAYEAAEAAAEAAYEAGLDARDRGDDALAETKLLEAARLRRPNGLALARAGLAALARGAEARANDLFREALVDLELETRERPHPAAHVPLACWGVFYTSVVLRWRDNRHLELRCDDGISVVDVPAHEEVERYPSSHSHPEPSYVTTTDGHVVDPSEGHITVSDAKTGRLVARRSFNGLGDARASPDGRSIAHLVSLPNPVSDGYHELVPLVRDVATGKDVDLSDLLHDPPPAFVRGPRVIGRTTHPGVITRGFQRFAWSVDIDGKAWDWNDEVRCDGDLQAHEGDLLRCLAPYGPITFDERATKGEAHCRIGRHVLPLVVCSNASSPSRTPLVTR